MVKNIDYDPMSKKVLALDFQALVAGEVVSATVPVHFLNEEIVQGVFEPELPRSITKQTRLIFWNRLRSTWLNCLQVQRICM